MVAKELTVGNIPPSDSSGENGHPVHDEFDEQPVQNSESGKDLGVAEEKQTLGNIYKRDGSTL